MLFNCELFGILVRALRSGQIDNMVITKLILENCYIYDNTHIEYQLNNNRKFTNFRFSFVRLHFSNQHICRNYLYNKSDYTTQYFVGFVPSVDIPVWQNNLKNSNPRATQV